MARFTKHPRLGSGTTSIMGRGMVSGIKHKWSTSTGAQINDIDYIRGIAITDRASFSTKGGRHIEDVSDIGAWHGNNDGPDFLDDCLVENCFLQAFDDNLKLNHNSRARQIVIWQQMNAHPIMVKEIRNNVTFAESTVEDVDILAYFYDWHGKDWSRLSHAAIACVTGGDIQVRDFAFRDIRIESPFLYRVFCFYSMDTNQPYAASWFKVKTSADMHTRINGLTFEKITVHSPLILYRSLLGSAYDDSVSDISFAEIEISGTTVTEQNKDRFFEIDYDKVSGLTLSATSKDGPR
jgi:hypothetical protein